MKKGAAISGPKLGEENAPPATTVQSHQSK